MPHLPAPVRYPPSTAGVVTLQSAPFIVGNACTQILALNSSNSVLETPRCVTNSIDVLRVFSFKGEYEWKQRAKIGRLWAFGSYPEHSAPDGCLRVTWRSAVLWRAVGNAAV
eukprot:COSAG02_NODE_140_length_34374_cov_913.416443_8_plen_112_part_00